ncbi:hypothetical protein B1756_17890 [Natrarchaeobaculum aegyptiacum]|uniref:Envelope protein N-terminal domain-containing protein n=2 Tax=Natrarchaeobaculum aegyptiacum TaxID=745377 RepID=A0A2Z2HVS4_9EURY|nr:hypothetical protein B1756_17890 [Natrarchaeobaculum aegyptiacum]
MAVLLVSSMFAAPVAASDGSGDCLYEQIGIPWFSCQPDDPVEVTQDETIMHSMATSEAESMDAHYTTLDNQLEDTGTIASLEARHAIAESWENGESESEAYQNALEAIRDYYAVHQENHIEVKSKQLVQLSNTAHAAQEDDDIMNRWVSVDDAGDLWNSNDHYVTDGTAPAQAELVNGETHNYTTARVVFDSDAGGCWDGLTGTFNFSTLDTDYWTYNSNYKLSAQDTLGGDDCSERSPGTYGKFVIPNVGDVEDGGLPSETVFDHSDWLERWEDIEQQSDQVVSNYDTQFVSDLYAELDAGNLDPEDVRGAEGMARHLSGDSEVTEQRFQMALMQMSGMNNPDLAGTSSMTVEYDGHTEIEFEGTEGDSRVPVYSGHVEAEYDGLLFANDVPEGGFETNQTYATGEVNTTDTDLEAVDGGVQMFDVETGETTHFYNGTFEVTEMYDADGNEVETVEWEQPKYDTYDASEFADYIEEVQELREEIDSYYAEAHGGGGGGEGIDMDTDTLLMGGALLVVLSLLMAYAGGRD